MNRLTSGAATAAADDGLALGWTYGRYGSRWAQTASGSRNASAVQPNLAFNGRNNQIAGWSCDADGNLLNDSGNSYTSMCLRRSIKQRWMPFLSKAAKPGAKKCRPAS
jgi:hypothetical protein